MSDNKTRSILLQVAFKEAATASLGTDNTVEALTLEYFNVLIKLHKDLGISLEQGSGGGGGGNYAPRPAKALPEAANSFTDSEGTQWIDYRGAKAADQAIPTHPDFKSVGTTPIRSVWLYKKDGSENAEAITLAAAADQMAALTAPM